MLPTVVLAALLAASPPAERLFYAVDDAAGVASLVAHGAEVDVLAPQVLTLEADGTLAGALPPALAAAARACRIPLVPLVVNPGFRPEPILEVLDSPERQARAICFPGRGPRGGPGSSSTSSTSRRPLETAIPILSEPPGRRSGARGSR